MMYQRWQRQSATSNGGPPAMATRAWLNHVLFGLGVLLIGLLFLWGLSA